MSEEFGSSAAGKKGGKARAASLSADERREIARQAARARWGDSEIVVATHEGILDLAGTKIPCANLADGRRVVSERGLTLGFGLKRAGSNWQRKDDGARLPVFASANNLKSFLEKELLSALKSPILYRSESTRNIAHGVDAEIIPAICEAWLKARDAGVLKAQQAHIAVKAEMIVRGLSRVAIVALIDEATGFQRVRERDALAKILEAFVAKAIQDWIKTFDLEFYEMICDLRGLPIEKAKKRPKYFGLLTNNLVYERLAPGVLEELERRNPKDDSGNRKRRHHQHLTREFGHPKLREHLAGVTTAMKMAKLQGLEWDKFIELLDKTHPKWTPMPLFDQLDHPDSTR